MIELRHRGIDDTEASRSAYDEIYRRQGINIRDSFYLWLIELLRPERGRLLLDISCGEGRLVHLARQRGLAALGVDFSGDAVRKAAGSGARGAFAVGDGQRLPIADGGVDYVTHIGSLEHYADPAAGAREIARVLRPGGAACVLLPNAFGLLGNVQHVLRHGQVFDDFQPIQRYATRREWQSLLEEAGLEVRRVVPYGEIERPRAWRDVANLAVRPRRLLRALLVRLIPLNLANHFVYLCSRASGR